MNESKEKVLRIKKEYVGSDCIQIMIPYRNSLTLFNKNMMLYHYQKDSPIYINEYLNDERNENFPYHNIPIHFEKIGLKKYIFTNQLLNFDEPYIRIVDGRIIESYAIKDKDEALLLNKEISFESKIENKTRKEFEDMFTKKDNEKLYVMSLDGSLMDLNNLSFSTENEIISMIKKRMTDELNDYMNSLRYSNEYCFSDITINYFKNSIDNMTIDDIIDNTELINYDDILIVKTNDEGIDIKVLDITFMGRDRYKITSFNSSVNNYTLEQLKILTSKIFKPKNPKISLRLNEDITKKDIIDAKKMVKTLKKR